MDRWLSSGLILVTLAIAGCAHGVYRSGGGTIPYRVANDGCDCEHFVAVDTAARLICEFTGTYRVDERITTKIMVTLRNESRDTLDLSLATVRIVSRNLTYRYNDKFLPMSITAVLPGDRQTVTLVGDAPTREGVDPWLSIAGEELVLTIRGMRMQGNRLATQVIRFIPTNPRLTS